jgi:23S rRNA (adenine2503-C2)-methyltransferase
MQHLLDQSADDLRRWLAARGQPSYRADQLARWVFQRRAAAPHEMTDLPAALRRQLAEVFLLWTARSVVRQSSSDGTEKLLLEWADGQAVECVLLRDDRGHRTICISTQVGCGMGCAFCASGMGGLARNLTTGEIVEQMLSLQRLLPADERISHVVVMGMGEPLANLARLLPALQWATSGRGLGVSARRITVSTVGIPAGIRQLAADEHPYHLAVSLHAPDESLRNELVAANRKTGIGSILQAADDYFAATGRRVTFEYVLLADVNDQPGHARRLVDRLRGRPALVNLIPYNPVAGLPFRTPSPAATAAFARVLEEGGLNVQLRYRKGDRIDAACGQLRRRLASARPD